ncbi:hypothetical protein QUF63_16940, partial [Anaerolineales bacterium HSG25]|nr:hypothetical protein [Anaerolineales bacterium HSG25]
QMEGWISPRLGVRFELKGIELVLYRADGTRFLTFSELADKVEAETSARQQAEQRAETEALARQAETSARQQAEQRAETEALARQAEVSARQQAEQKLQVALAELAQLKGT